MTAKKDNKEELLKLIDKKAFDPILKTKADKYDGKEREAFEEIQKKTEKEKEKFHGYGSAGDVKKNFLQNVRSKPAKKLDKELEQMNLPTLPQLKDEFMALCEKLDV